MGPLTEDIIASGFRRSMAPNSQSTFTDSVAIDIANDELLLSLVAEIMAEREDFFGTTKTVSIESGVTRYGIPSRSIGNTFKALFYVAQGGEETKLERVDIDRLTEFGADSSLPELFYIEGDEVVLLGRPTNGALRFHYYASPNQLIATASCAKITGITVAGGSATFDVDTDLTASLTTSDYVDIVSRQSPHLLWTDEALITAISSTQIQVAASAVQNAAGTTEPQVGDYICPHGYSNLPMIPSVFHPVLAQKVANQMMESLGHLDKLQAGEARAARLMRMALSTIKNRVETSPIRANRANGLTRAFGG